MITAPARSRIVTAQSASNEYLLFHIGELTFAVEILRVREILRSSPLIPGWTIPGPIRGVLRHRERLVPVIDVRTHLTLPVRSCDRFSVILLLSVDDHSIALDVDSVSTVIRMGESEFEALSETDEPEYGRFVKGIGRHQDEPVFFLDVSNYVAAVLQLLGPIRTPTRDCPVAQSPECLEDD